MGLIIFNSQRIAYGRKKLVATTFQSQHYFARLNNFFLKKLTLPIPAGVVGFVVTGTSTARAGHEREKEREKAEC